MPTTQRISPCLWFDNQAEEAARFYTGIFPNSRINYITHYGEAGKEAHGQAPGTVMVVAFELDGHTFTALNGGPVFTFNEAISLQVNCANQQEIDYYWEKLGAGGDPRAQQCGWLKDRYGVSWQVIPNDLDVIYSDANPAGAARAMEAMLKMKKLDMDEMRRAFEGAES